MSEQTTSKNTPPATSSQGSEDGLSPSGSQDGVTTDLFGQEVLHVRTSQSQEAEKALKAREISIRYGSKVSSQSSSLQSFLEKKWRERLSSAGSIERKPALRKKITPSGRRLFELVLLEHPTDDHECSLSPTGMWATPVTMDRLAPRPIAAMEKHLTGARKGRKAPGTLREQVIPELYPSALWVTPSARDWKDSFGMSGEAEDGRIRHDQLPRQVFQAEIFGASTSGYCAETGSEEELPRLNPAFVCWLMGFPQNWWSLLCKAWETR